MTMAITFDTLDEVLGRSAALPHDLATLEHNLTAKAQADKAELKNDIALLGQKLAGDINLAKWMLGTLIAINIAVALKQILH